LPSVFLPEIKSLPNLNSGTTSDVNLRQRVLKVRFCLSMKFLREDQTTSRPSELFLDMNPEQATITCIRSTEMSLWMEPSVSYTQRWPVIIVRLPIQFLSSERLFSTKRRRLEDQEVSNTETTMLSSPFCELLLEPVTRDTEVSSKPTDPIPSDNDPRFELSKYLNLYVVHL
jgi:hypothetical protein